jgi:hypothetical protein
MNALPLLAIALADRRRGRALAQMMLPALIPGSSGQRAAVAAVTAQQEIRRAERREERIATDAVGAVAKVALPTQRLTDTDLQALPALAEVLNRLPAVRPVILRPALPNAPAMIVVGGAQPQVFVVQPQGGGDGQQAQGAAQPQVFVVQPQGGAGAAGQQAQGAAQPQVFVVQPQDAAQPPEEGQLQPDEQPQAIEAEQAVGEGGGRQKARKA